ncbi:MAG: polyribonucleotide nucleotidyltransferase [Armatimonadota bacterium]
MPINRYETELAGKKIIIEQGKIANQANGAVWLTCGDTIVMATATMSAEPKEGIDFFPLMVDYEERKYAVGKIPGGFVKRGGRPSEKAILTARLIDRPIRPLFSEGMRNEVQIIAMPLSMELEVPADILCLNAASAALAISDIPWNGPIGAVRVCKVDGELVMMPSIEQIQNSEFELVIAGVDGKMLEIEFEGNEIPEDELEEALEFAHKGIDVLVEFQRKMVEQFGKPKAAVPMIVPDADLMEEISQKIIPEIQNAIRNPVNAGKESAIFELKENLKIRLSEEYPDNVDEIGDILEKVIKKQVRKMILDENARPDGRAIDEIRPLSAEVGLLPRVHGSGLFSRGQTQVLTTVTLGSLDDSQTVDNLEEDSEKRFMHYYNFPPFSVGEAKPLRGAGRREIGHGALAEKALRPMIPDQNDFPYAMLLTSEVLESNGSTSMASTCGCTLALMDAGVPIKQPVAGISIGLVSDETRKVLLTDIMGLEDFTGDMDFKVAGTVNGITAIQVDTKTQGLDKDVVSGALARAKEARFKILDVIHSAIPAVNEKLSPYAPRVYVVVIHPDKIGDIIGPGGKVIKKIEAETGAKLDIEQDGHVYITSPDAAGGEKAKKIVEDITREVAVGEVYTGKVTRIESFGAFVEFLPGRDGLVHISQLANERVNRTEDVCSIGDEMLVKVIEIGDDGKIRLTRKGILENGADVISSQSRGRSGGNDFRDSDRGRVSRGNKSSDDEFPKAKFRPKR